MKTSVVIREGNKLLICSDLADFVVMEITYEEVETCDGDEYQFMLLYLDIDSCYRYKHDSEAKYLNEFVNNRLHTLGLSSVDIMEELKCLQY